MKRRNQGSERIRCVSAITWWQRGLARHHRGQALQAHTAQVQAVLCSRNGTFVLHCKKKISDFPVSSRDFTNQTTLPGHGRVCLVTSRLGTGKSLTFFYSVYSDFRRESCADAPQSPKYMYQHGGTGDSAKSFWLYRREESAPPSPPYTHCPSRPFNVGEISNKL